MNKWFLVMMAIIFLAGCASARESGFYEHSTIYKDWDHMKFSLGGYKKMDQKDGQESNEQDWWGTSVQVPQK